MMSLPRSISWRRHEAGSSPLPPPPSPQTRRDGDDMVIDGPVIEVLSSAMALTETGKLPPPPPVVNKKGNDASAPSLLKLDLKSRRKARSCFVASDRSHYSSRTQMTESTGGTAATASTAGTWESSSPSASSESSSVKRRKKIVHWNESSVPATNKSNESIVNTTTFELDRVRLGARSPPPTRHSSKSPPRTASFSKRKEREREVQHLEANIQKAAQMELSLLNKAKVVRGKRDRLHQSLAELEEKLQQRSAKSCPTDDIEGHIDHVLAKIDKANRVEKCYLKKCKQVHDKRYRWTKLHEVASRELKTQLDSLLPPLVASSSLRKAIVHELGN